MIANDRLRSFAITPLKRGLQKEWSTPWRSAGRDADFSVLHLFRSIYLVPIKLANTFVDFQCCHLKKNWKSPHRSFKKLCDKSLKIKKVRCTKSSSFRGERRGMWLFFWRLCLRVVNRRRKWSKLKNSKIRKIYQNVLPKSGHKNEKIFFLSGTVLKPLSSRSFCTPHFWSGASGKWINFMIAKWLLWSFWVQKCNTSTCIDLV